MNILNSPWVVNIITGVIVSVAFLLLGRYIGRRQERKKYEGKNLEEYDFYPFNVDSEKRPYFDLKDFRLAIYYLLKHKDYKAARQLILLGEQNEVRLKLASEDLREYEKLYTKYKGSSVINIAHNYLDNYKRIVKLIGASFPDSGIEILLHDLVNPAKSLAVLENNVTGRRIEDGATNLVLDLKMRKMQNQDKLNYELNIGARKFKCTTIPIFKEDYGLIGAICINVDANYLTMEVGRSQEKIAAFLQRVCKTEMQLDENILSKSEYELAMKGKTHWMDNSVI